MSLDRQKSYSEVFGPGIPYKFEQDGKYFDQGGNEVTSDGAPVFNANKPGRKPQALPAGTGIDGNAAGLDAGGLLDQLSTGQAA